MLRENYLLLTSLILIHFIPTSSYAQQQNPSCNPSACGNIHNISHPFRLKNDPKDCGDPAYEISCDNNTPSIYMDSQSHGFHVQTINYHNYTIRLADPDIKNNDTCSFPIYSLDYYDLFIGRSYFIRNYPYDIHNYTNLNTQIVREITFLSCPFPLNDSVFTEIEDCVNRNSNRSRRTYIVVGELNASNVRDMCRFDNAVLTSFPFKDETNISLLEIHESLLYGFELSWFSALCGGNCRYCAFDGKKAYCSYVGFGNWFLNLVYGTLEILTLASMLNVALRILIGMPIMLGLLICKLRRRHLSVFDLIENFLQNNNNLMPIRYSYSDIKKMTRGFREKLGQGGYGSVYRGKLRSGSVVAVKVLNKSRGDGQDFINEVATIGRIHHVNVVKLVGYCAERSKCALLYDFMPNGSLDKYLFSRQESDGNSLSWETKYNIAVGVARGIDYLHRGCDIQILHFDIKPHNILLDENFIPKISDFGLAKSYSTEKNTVTLTAARGTIGYVAPELMNRSIGGVSYKADVYSFGMLLMEMVGLKKDMAANDHTSSSSQYFPDWIYDRFSKHKDIEMGKLDDDYTKKITRKMTIVALWCIQMSPSDRPSMSKVLEMLESETELLQIPLQHFQPPNVAGNAQDETWGTDSTDSIALLHDHDASKDQLI